MLMHRLFAIGLGALIAAVGDGKCAVRPGADLDPFPLALVSTGHIGDELLGHVVTGVILCREV